MQISKENYHEINHYPDPLFPVEIYRVDESGMFPFGRGVGDFHWHEELQFTMALQGTLTIQADARRYTLKEGQAFFINSGVIHAVTELSAGGVYASLNFPSKLLSFFPGSRMEQDDVLPWVTGGVPASLLLTCETGDGSAVLTCLSEILRFWPESFPHRSYGIAIRLAELWYHTLPCLEHTAYSTPSLSTVKRQRIQDMLSFIYAHYAEDITLTVLARCAHISVGECCRIFREQLQVTPYQFLTDYRIRKSLELLTSDFSVSETAGLCGYNQVSNYISKFKSLMGCTPAQYQNRVGGR